MKPVTIANTAWWKNKAKQSKVKLSILSKQYIINTVVELTINSQPIYKTHRSNMTLPNDLLPTHYLNCFGWTILKTHGFKCSCMSKWKILYCVYGIRWYTKRQGDHWWIPPYHSYKTTNVSKYITTKLTSIKEKSILFAATNTTRKISYKTKKCLYSILTAWMNDHTNLFIWIHALALALRHG